MTEANYHAVSDGKTRCGLDARGQEYGGEGVLLLIAPDRESVTCPACLAAMPGDTRGAPASEVVQEQLTAEQKRFERRDGAPPVEPPVDRDAVAEKAKQTIEGGQ